MRCMNHSEREAVQSCAHCGKDYCEECMVDVNGRRLCKTCVSELAGHKRHHRGDAYGRYHYYMPHKYRIREKNHSKFLLFLLSLLPGLGYMYMGLVKRGLFVMSAFFLNIYLLSMTEMVLLAFAIPVIFFASFFDGFRLLRQIKAGETVTDNIDDIKNFVSANKGIMLVGLGGILLFGVLGNLIAWMGRIAPLLLIAIGVYFFFNKNKNRVDSKKEENRDKYYDSNNQ